MRLPGREALETAEGYYATRFQARCTTASRWASCALGRAPLAWRSRGASICGVTAPQKERETMGVLICVVLSVSIAIVSHLIVRRFVPALLLAVVASVLTFQVIVAIQLGHLDPMAPIAVVTTTPVALTISALIGGFIWIVRSRPKE